MARIQVLDKHTAELIAAGEVVERPASVVKELAENAIDAGAHTITVDIQNGGVTSMTITDDGCGFVREDVPMAFLRHATSKIQTEDDLDGIATLGFRGEALASVAAVARVELITRTEDDLAGTHYVIEGGEEVSFTDIGCPRGTTICVRDLFYNVPARMKFLKKDVGEANAVAGVVDRLALSHPEISFRFIRDGKDELLTPGNGDLYACINAVLGREFAKTLTPLDYSLGGVHVHGFICRPDGARPNRTMQHFFVNGRYVKTRTAMAAVEQAYKGLIMGGRFPSCVLHVDLPAETVDVNVHPAKIEVRFVNEKPVFDAVYHGVKNALQGDQTPRQAVLTPPPAKAAAPIVNAPTPAREWAAQTASRTVPMPPPSPPRTMPKPHVPVLRDEEKPFARSEKTVTETVVPPPPKPEPQPIPEPILPIVDEQVTLEQEQPPVVYIGELMHTYVLAEWQGSLYIIDKHAAHERILYNELKQTATHDSQYLLAPVCVSLSRDEYGVLVEHLTALADVGFEVEEFDGALLVRAIPSVLTGGDETAALREIAGRLLGGKRDVTTDRMDWIYHSIACRAAIKAGDSGTAKELAVLATRVLTDADIRTCPHGRPVCVELSKKELEKQFGRIV